MVNDCEYREQYLADSFLTGCVQLLAGMDIPNFILSLNRKVLTDLYAGV